MSRRGSHAVEFALILPVFIMLVFGGIELLWYAVEVGKVQSALVAGCRGGESLVEESEAWREEAPCPCRAQCLYG